VKRIVDTGDSKVLLMRIGQNVQKVSWCGGTFKSEVFIMFMAGVRHTFRDVYRAKIASMCSVITYFLKRSLGTSVLFLF